MPQPPPRRTPNLYGAWDKTEQPSNMARAGQSTATVGHCSRHFLDWTAKPERQGCQPEWHIHQPSFPPWANKDKHVALSDFYAVRNGEGGRVTLSK